LLGFGSRRLSNTSKKIYKRLFMNYLNFSWLLVGQLAGHEAPSSEQDLIWLKEHGIFALLRMAEKDRVNVNVEQIESLGLIDCHDPVSDFTAPTISQIERMIAYIEKSRSEGKPVGVSCGAGFGPTGAILACYLVSKCMSSAEAIAEIHLKRPGSVETSEQEDAIREYAHFLGEDR